MNLLRLFRLIFGFMSLSIVEDGGGAEPAGTVAPVAPVIETPAAPVATPAAPDKPATALEAMFGKEGEQTAEQKAETLRGKGPRDPAGKFVPKVGADGQPVPAKTATEMAAKPAEPAKPEDLLTKPEGLTPKAEARFQALANENRALTEKADLANRQVEYVKNAFHEHQVKPEQFEQATRVIGMLNRGDYDGAVKVLQSQIQQIAILTGKPVGQIDALAHFPDLRAAVDEMQITEAHAMEIARGRAERFAGQQRQQHEQQAQQDTQKERAAVQSGTIAVEAFCKRMQASDLDYSAVEAQLLPEIQNLIRGAHPDHWAGIVETNYRILKTAAGKFRQPSAPTGNALRPTGTASPGQQPKSMFEAQWGHASA